VHSPGTSEGATAPNVDVRLYLMAAPCSGKTVFAREYSGHRGVEVLDFGLELQSGPR
jgi:hypothetical protein